MASKLVADEKIFKSDVSSKAKIMKMRALINVEM